MTATSINTLAPLNLVREAIFCISLIIYFGTSSIYLFPSGLPQPADIILGTGCIIYIFGRCSINRKSLHLLLASAAFLTYVFLTGLVWAVSLQDLTPLRPTAFYGFNILIFWALIKFGETNRHSLRIIALGLGISAISLTLQAALGFETNDLRQRLNFNNPNQLGFYSLCLTGLALITYKARKLNELQFYALFSVCSIIAFLSFSLATMAAWMAGAGALIVLKMKHSIRIFIVTLTILGGLTIAALLYGLQSEYLAQSVAARVSRIEEKTTNLAASRGYYRILNNPKHLVLGAGEGALWRWSDDGYANEIHSTPGTLMFSYGIPGSVLFCILLWLVLRGTGFFGFLIFCLPLINGLLHHGLRTTIAWILLASLTMVKEKGDGGESDLNPVAYN